MGALAHHKLAAQENAVLLPDVAVEEFSIEATMAGESVAGIVELAKRVDRHGLRRLIAELDPEDVKARIEATEFLKFVEALRGIV